jgi:uncharacterized phage protein (TIGR02218 family)
MRTLEAGIAAHLAGGQTTLATCWKLTRGDGVVLGFTDHDAMLSFGGTDYVPAHGLDGGEAAQKLGPQTDTTEVVGVLQAEAISEDDILLGRYDGAAVETWRVNWRDTGERYLVRRATIGEIVREDGVFRAELRSPQHALNVVKGRRYQALCDAALGDARCGIDLEDPDFRAEGSVAEVRDRFHLAVNGTGAYAIGWFGFGHVVWTSGKRERLRDRIVSHQRIGGADILSFDKPVGEWVEPADEMTIYAGCDRRFETCRERFGNAVNFRGFPHVPGNDVIMRVVKPGDRVDGGALLK